MKQQELNLYEIANELRRDIVKLSKQLINILDLIEVRLHSMLIQRMLQLQKRYLKIYNKRFTK